MALECCIESRDSKDNQCSLFSLQACCATLNSCCFSSHLCTVDILPRASTRLKEATLPSCGCFFLLLIACSFLLHCSLFLRLRALAADSAPNSGREPSHTFPNLRPVSVSRARNSGIFDFDVPLPQSIRGLQSRHLCRSCQHLLQDLEAKLG